MSCCVFGRMLALVHALFLCMWYRDGHFFRRLKARYITVSCCIAMFGDIALTAHCSKGDVAAYVQYIGWLGTAKFCCMDAFENHKPEATEQAAFVQPQWEEDSIHAYLPMLS